MKLKIKKEGWNSNRKSTVLGSKVESRGEENTNSSEIKYSFSNSPQLKVTSKGKRT